MTKQEIPVHLNNGSYVVTLSDDGRAKALYRVHRSGIRELRWLSPYWPADGVLEVLNVAGFTRMEDPYRAESYQPDATDQDGSVITKQEIHATLQELFEKALTLKDGIHLLSSDTVFAIGEATGAISKAKALVGRDIDQERARARTAP
jgi:hypothetical protein